MNGTGRIILLGAAIATLAGCATREGFEARQATLVGRSEADLVATLGVPARVYEAEGRRFLQYEDRRIISYPGSVGFGYGFGYRHFGHGGFGPSIETRACDVTYELRGGRVIGFAARGNACVAAEPRTA